MQYRKITIVFPGQPSTKTQGSIYLHLPLSSISLAAYIRERGYQPSIYDMRIRNQKVDLSSIDVVGIGCMTGHQVKYGLEFAAEVRKHNPSIPIIWGGVHPTLYPEQTLENPLVDYVVRGEGEETLFQLLEALNGNIELEDVEGINYTRDGKNIANPDREMIKDLDTLPFPAYDLVNMGDYPNIGQVFDYQTSRGCPFRCAFCYNLRFNKRRWRAKSPEKVVSELLEIKRRYQITGIGFVDDELFINPKRTEKLVDLFIEKQLNIRWSASCRLDILLHLKDEVVQKIKQSGCRKLYFGAESGSPKILKEITKDITVDDMFDGAKKCVRNGIPPVLSFMSGFPSETHDDLMHTYQVISDLWKIDPKVEVNGVFVFNPYPGGPLFTEALQAGFQVPDNLADWGEWSYKYDAELPWVDPNKRQTMRSMFLMVRLSYYWKELSASSEFIKKYIFRPLIIPMKLSLHIRWKRKWFSHIWEWRLMEWFLIKMFGYL